MTEQAFPLTMFYQGWETYQQSLVETITPLSSEHLALLGLSSPPSPSSPGSRTARSCSEHLSLPPFSPVGRSFLTSIRHGSHPATRHHVCLHYQGYKKWDGAS